MPDHPPHYDPACRRSWYKWALGRSHQEITWQLRALPTDDREGRDALRSILAEMERGKHGKWKTR